MGDQDFPVNNATMLQFDWDEVHGSSVLAIVGEAHPGIVDDGLTWRAVALVLGAKAVILTVNDDTCEIIVSLADAEEVRSEAWHPIAGLQFLVGEDLAWCWIGRNYRGYLDGFTLAFGAVVPEALEPRVMFVGEGIGLSCLLLQPLTNPP